MVESARVQCIFLDVVGFTVNRSVEAQADVVATLNEVVRDAMESLHINSRRTVLLPTGDGMAIALLNPPSMDLHLRLALHILETLDRRNNKEKDHMRRFRIRIGINENIDNVVLDINRRRNIAGDGISMAQRIMDNADGGQVLVSHTVYETLRHREKYLNSFRQHAATGKHGLHFQAYQYVSLTARGLNSATPSAFSAKKAEPQKFSQLVAYYVAHTLRNQKFLQSRKGDPCRDRAAILLLTLLAEDSTTAANTPEHEEAGFDTWKAGVAPFEEQYKHYYEMDYWPLARLADFLAEKNLHQFDEFFEDKERGYMKCYCILKSSAQEKLAIEWPDIAREFGLQSTANKAMEPTVATVSKKKGRQV